MFFLFIYLFYFNAGKRFYVLDTKGSVNTIESGSKEIIIKQSLSATFHNKTNNTVNIKVHSSDTIHFESFSKDDQQTISLPVGQLINVVNPRGTMYLPTFINILLYLFLTLR